MAFDKSMQLAFQRVERITHRHVEILMAVLFVMIMAGHNFAARHIDNDVNAIEFALVVLPVRFLGDDAAGGYAGTKTLQLFDPLSDTFIGKQRGRKITVCCLKVDGHWNRLSHSDLWSADHVAPNFNGST